MAVLATDRFMHQQMLAVCNISGKHFIEGLLILVGIVFL